MKLALLCFFSGVSLSLHALDLCRNLVSGSMPDSAWAAKVGDFYPARFFETRSEGAGVFGVTVDGQEPAISLYNADGSPLTQLSLRVNAERSANYVIAASPDGMSWAAGGLNGDLIFFPTLKERNIHHTQYKNSVAFVTFSPDGTRVFTSGDKSPDVTVWSPNGQEVGTWRSDLQSVFAMDFLTPETVLIRGWRERSQLASVWKVDERRKIREMETQFVNQPVLTRSGNYLIGKTLREWVRIPLPHLTPVESLNIPGLNGQPLSVSSSGKYFAWESMGDPLEIRVWDQSQKRMLSLKPTSEGIDGVSKHIGFSHDESHVWMVTRSRGGEHKNVYVWDLRAPNENPARF